MIDINLGNKKIFEIERSLLKNFQDNCELLKIDYTLTEEAFNLLPALREKTFIIYMNDNRLEGFVQTIKSRLIKNAATCQVVDKPNFKGFKAIKKGIILSLTYDESEVPEMKFYSLTQEEGELMSKIVNSIISAELEVDCHAASALERLLNTRYRNLTFKTGIPALQVEFRGTYNLSRKLAEIFSQSILQVYGSNISNEEIRNVFQLVKEIYSKINYEEVEEEGVKKASKPANPFQHLKNERVNQFVPRSTFNKDSTTCNCDKSCADKNLESSLENLKKFPPKKE